MERAKVLRVLIVKLSSLGDVVHTLPALRALRMGYESSGTPVEIDWLVEEAASGILLGHPMIDEVIVVKRDGWIRGPAENHRKSRYLASKSYDIVIDFQGLLKSAIWVHLSKGKRRVGFSNAREMSYLFLNEKLPAYDPQMHAVDRYMLLASHVSGFDGATAFPIHINAYAEKKVSAMLETMGVSAPFIAITPASRWETKHWRAEGFAQLIEMIRERLGLYVVLAGSANDRALIEDIRAKSSIKDGVFNIAGKTDLSELTAFISLTEFLVTVDSGPMHIAAAVGARIVALFGPTSHERTGPYGPGHIIIKKDYACRPCFKRKCPDPICMSDITAGDVFQAIVHAGIIGTGLSTSSV